MPTLPELEAQLNSVTDLQARIDLLNEIAWEINVDDQQRARELAEQSYRLSTSGEFEKEPYLAGLVGSLRSQAVLENDAGNYDLALSQSLRALEILDGLSEVKPEITLMKIDILGTIAWTYRSLGDYGAAAENAMDSLKLAQAMGDRRREAGKLNVLSVIYAESNDLNAALEIGLKCLQYNREEGAVRGESVALNNLAMTYLELGQHAQALEACRESYRLADENGNHAVALTALATMGEVYLGMNDFARAEEVLSQSLSLARENNSGSDELNCLFNLGKVYQSQQNDRAALSAFQNALALSLTCSDRRTEFLCHQYLSEVYDRRGEYKAALKHYKQFHALKETVFNENTAKRLAGLQVVHQVETAKRDAEIHYLRTIELKREIEERKSVQESLQKLASIDPLTGTLNRREFFIQAERELAQALEKKQSLTAILFDLDYLKNINDTYGHLTGDQVLIHTAKIVHENLRQSEIIGRYGGDEFVILLPGSNAAQGKQIAGRLCEKTASQPIATDNGKLSLTISLGVAEINPVSCSNLETLLAHADQALYEAKRAGRNRLAIYPGPLA